MSRRASFLVVLVKDMSVQMDLLRKKLAAEEAVLKFLRAQEREKAKTVKVLKRDLENLERTHRLARWTEARQHASLEDLWALRQNTAVHMRTNAKGVRMLVYQGTHVGKVLEDGQVITTFNRQFHLRHDMPDGTKW